MSLSSSFLRANYEQLAQKALECKNDTKLNAREVSESFESLGLSQFYSGNFHDSIKNFIYSYKLRQQYPQDRGNARLCILIGIAHFRRADLDSAEKYFLRAITAAQIAAATDLNATASCNLANLYTHKSEFPKAIVRAEDALELAGKVYSKSSAELIGFARVAVSIFIRVGEVSKAEKLLEKTDFSEQESALLSAACSMSKGQTDAAKDSLVSYKTKTQTKQMSSMMFSDREVSGSDLATDSLLDAIISYDLAVISLKKKKVEDAGYYLQVALQKGCQLTELGAYEDSDDESRLETKHDAHVRGEVDSVGAQSSLDSAEEAGVHRHTSGTFFAAEVERNAVEPLLEDGQEVALETCDDLLAPRVLVSQLFVAQAEQLLLTRPLYSALDLQCGAVSDSSLTEVSDFFSEVSALLRQSVRVISSLDMTSPTVAAETEPTVATNVSSGVSIDDSVASVDLDKKKQQQSGTDKTKKRVNVYRSIDVAAAEEVVQSYLRLLAFGTGDNEVTNDVSHSLKETYGKRTDQPVNIGYRAASPDSGNNARSKKPSSAAKSIPTFKSAVVEPSHSDTVTVRAEMLPAVSFQTPEQHYWIQWALSLIGGVGFGFLGSLGSLGVGEVSLDSATLDDAIDRLVHVRDGLSPDDLSSQLVVTVALTKLFANCNMKKETERSVLRLEDLAERVGDGQFIALSKKFRLDLEDWITSMNPPMTSASKMRRLQSILVHAKAFVNSSEAVADLQIRKDALKRLMNVYVEMAQVPLDGSLDVEELGTQQELDDLTIQAVESFEAADVNWLRRFAKCRAGEVLERMLHVRSPTEAADKEAQRRGSFLSASVASSEERFLEEAMAASDDGND